MSSEGFSIQHATTPADISDSVLLFKDYAASLGVDLSFQDFEQELSAMPGKYAAPSGTLLLVRSTLGQAIGCVGLRPRDESAGTCEMKRLYVAPAARGLGVGRALAYAVVDEARRLGYERIRLDTLERLAGAMAIYRGMGFVEISAYYQNPVEGAIFMELDLNSVNGTSKANTPK